MALIKATWDEPEQEPACGKHRYLSVAAATRAMAAVLSRRGRRPDTDLLPGVYFCERCTAHHWGNRPAKFARRRYSEVMKADVR